MAAPGVSLYQAKMFSFPRPPLLEGEMTAMFTPWKTEEPLRGMELQEKKEGKLKENKKGL